MEREGKETLPPIVFWSRSQPCMTPIQVHDPSGEPWTGLGVTQEDDLRVTFICHRNTAWSRKAALVLKLGSANEIPNHFQL